MRLAQELQALAESERIAFALRGDAIGVSARAGEGLSFSRGALAHEDVRERARAALRAAPRRSAAYDAKRLLHALREARSTQRALRRRRDDRGAPARSVARLCRDRRCRGAAARCGASRATPRRTPTRPCSSSPKTRAELRARDQLRLYEERRGAARAGAGKDGIGRRHASTRASFRRSAKRSTRPPRACSSASTILPAKTFNIGSPQQLGKVLFGKLGIPGSKKTKTGWATGVEVLQSARARVSDLRARAGMARSHQAQEHVRRRHSALVDPRDGRLRTEFNQTATATGRLSSTNPNLQNIPVRGELGRRIRRAFVARSDEYVLLAADYSQIELRLMAHLSGDAAMRAAFEEARTSTTLPRARSSASRRALASTRTSAGWPRASTSGSSTACRTSGWRSVSRSAAPKPRRSRPRISRAFPTCARTSSVRSRKDGATATSRRSSGAAATCRA